MLPERFWLRGLGILLFLTPFSAQAMEFTEFGVVNINIPSVSSSTDTSLQSSAGLSFGLGFSIGITVLGDWQIEPAFLYLGRNYGETSSITARTSYGMTVFQVPIVVRYRFSDHFSAGLGAFWSNTSGDMSINQGGQVISNATAKLPRDHSDSGITASFRYRTPLNYLMSLTFDARYLLGLNNKDTSGVSSLYYREIQLWAGMSFVL